MSFPTGPDQYKAQVNRPERRTWTLPSGAMVTFEGTPQVAVIRAIEDMILLCKQAYAEVKDRPLLSPSLEMAPQEIVEAARTLQTWHEKQGATRWELMGVCSRHYAMEVEAENNQLRGLVREIYVWTDYKHTPWAKRAAKLLGL